MSPMSERKRANHRAFTRIVRALSVLPAAVAVVLFAAASPAAATTAPYTWEKGEGMSTLQLIGTFVGGPLLLFVVIWIFALATARNNHVPPSPSTEVEQAGPQH